MMRRTGEGQTAGKSGPAGLNASKQGERRHRCWRHASQHADEVWQAPVLLAASSCVSPADGRGKTACGGTGAGPNEAGKGFCTTRTGNVRKNVLCLYVQVKIQYVPTQRARLGLYSSVGRA